jgi:hypothetical protein
VSLKRGGAVDEISGSRVCPPLRREVASATGCDVGGRLRDLDLASEAVAERVPYRFAISDERLLWKAGKLLSYLERSVHGRGGDHLDRPRGVPGRVTVDRVAALRSVATLHRHAHSARSASLRILVASRGACRDRMPSECRRSVAGRAAQTIRCANGRRTQMTVSSVLDSAGRRRSPATLAGYHARRAPRNKGMLCPPISPPWRRSSP